MWVSVPAKFLHYLQHIIKVVIKLLVGSLNYWRGNIELLGGHWTDCLFWTVHTKHTKKTKIKKGFQCPKDETMLKGECCKSFSWFIIKRSEIFLKIDSIPLMKINEENTEHPLPLIEVLKWVSWIRCGNYSKPGTAKLTNHSASTN